MAQMYMEKSVLFAVSPALASVISLSCCNVCVCVWLCVFTLKYWVGQKVHSCFSRTSYRKTRMNFRANPISHWNNTAFLRRHMLSVQFSHSVMSDSVWPRRLQHAKLPCPLPTLRAYSNSCPSSRWCHMPSSHLILCCPLFLLFPIPPSIRVFSNESNLWMRWPKYWSFSFSIIPSREIPGLISFRMNWLDLLAFQGTLKSLLQHHSSNALILWRSAFFTVQLSHPYMTTGKTIALTRRTLVGKVMSLLLNTLGWSKLFFQGVSVF